MERIKTLKTEIAQLSADATALYSKMEADTKEQTTENREKFQKMVDDGMAKRKELVTLENLESLKLSQNPGQSKVGADGQPIGDPAGGDGAYSQPYSGGSKSWGQAVLDSEQYKRAKAEWSSGRMDRVKVGNAAPVLGVKALSSTPAEGGYLYRPDRQPDIIDIARQRPFSILDMINVIPTESESVEYIEMSSRTNNSAVVPEQDAGRTHVSAGAGITADMIAADNGNFQENFAMKPKGALSFALKNALVKVIAEWIPASRQILSDAPRLRGTVDNELTYMLRVKLEDMIVSANETGFVGILNALNIGTRVHKTSGRGWTANDTVADTLRRMQTDIQLAFYEMDAYILSPTVAESLELEKAAGSGQYYNVFDPVQQRVWRKRVAISNALYGANSGTAIAGNFAMGATLWDREDVNVRVGEPGNFFLENAVAILGELRAAFAVVRGQAFEKATGLPG